jgi:hypothetical protein
MPALPCPVATTIEHHSSTTLHTRGYKTRRTRHPAGPSPVTLTRDGVVLVAYICRLPTVLRFDSGSQFLMPSGARLQPSGGSHIISVGATVLGLMHSRHLCCHDSRRRQSAEQRAIPIQSIAEAPRSKVAKRATVAGACRRAMRTVRGAVCHARYALLWTGGGGWERGAPPHSVGACSRPPLSTVGALSSPTAS